jgi:glycerol kinase
VTRDLIVAVDQGTGSTKALLLDPSLKVLASATQEIGIETSSDGFVQQDPLEILESVISVIDRVSVDHINRIAGLALTNQRESALAFSPSGGPLSKVLGWQDRRTVARAEAASDEFRAEVKEVTGLPLDPMFSALKFQWILDQIDPDRLKANSGELLLGTIDSWIVHSLTGAHLVEVGNAHRTQLVELSSGTWNKELTAAFEIPSEALPKISASKLSGVVLEKTVLKGLPFLAIMADSHAALFAHGTGMKITFGTGSSLMSITQEPVANSGLVSTIAWGESESNTLALEGNILSSGATITWLSRLFGLSTKELAERAEHGESEMVLVPAFGGLGAPWWDSQAKSLAIGMTLDSDVSNFARAGFESMVFQSLDLVLELEKVTGKQVVSIGVDGGPTSNPWFCQLLADLTQRVILPASIAELSAVGVAKLAGSEIWPPGNGVSSKRFEPKITKAVAEQKYQTWANALERSRGRK